MVYKKDELFELLDFPEKFMLQAGGEYEIISEISFLRSLIKYKNYRIVIYGAGVMGEYIERWLRMENIPIEFVIDNDKCKRGKKCGKTDIFYLEDMITSQKNRGRYKILAIIATAYYEIEKEKILLSLFKLGIEECIYAFDPRYGIAPCKYNWVSYYLHHKKDLINTYDLMSDLLSEETYIDFIKANISNCYYRGYKGKTKKKYFECYEPLKNEVFLNIGSYIGDTIFYFVENRSEKFEHIYAVEGNKDNYQKLMNYLNIFPENIRDKIETICTYLNECNTEDIANDATLINMDIEGAELSVLTGLKNIIVNNRPVLAVCAYHKPEDIVEIPKFINEVADDYLIYFRKYAAAYSSPLGNGESVIYGVPRERMLK